MIFEIGIYHYTILSAFLFFTGVFWYFLKQNKLNYNTYVTGVNSFECEYKFYLFFCIFG